MLLRFFVCSSLRSELLRMTSKIFFVIEQSYFSALILYSPPSIWIVLTEYPSPFKMPGISSIADGQSTRISTTVPFSALASFSKTCGITYFGYGHIVFLISTSKCSAIFSPPFSDFFLSKFNPCHKQVKCYDDCQGNN